MKMQKASNKKNMVYRILKEDIIRDQLKEGEILIENVLTDRFKVSKTPIREAFQQLERDGLISNIPRKGTFVTHITLRHVKDIFELREIVECGAVRLATSVADLSKLREVKRNIQNVLDKNQEAFAAILHSGDELHNFICDSLGNDRLSQIYGSIMDQARRIRVFFLKKYTRDRLVSGHAEHLEIVNAILARDVDRAERAMRIHIHATFEAAKNLI
jgi:DNA-binding GntR family transcriptional regulator